MTEPKSFTHEERLAMLCAFSMAFRPADVPHRLTNCFVLTTAEGNIAHSRTVDLPEPHVLAFTTHEFADGVRRLIDGPGLARIIDGDGFMARLPFGDDGQPIRVVLWSDTGRETVDAALRFG